MSVEDQLPVTGQAADLGQLLPSPYSPTSSLPLLLPLSRPVFLHVCARRPLECDDGFASAPLLHSSFNLACS